MSLKLRYMREGEEDAAAVLIKQLPRAIGLDVVPKLTGAILREASDVAKVTVAEDAGLIVSVCLWTMTFSSWRGMKGIYVSDLFVMDHVRGRNIGEALLRYTMLEARKLGAGFVKLEVDHANVGAQRFYQRHGFVHKPEDQFHVLEPAAFDAFVEGTVQ
jgi:ribosomal protein S18 acetylase RimI-like enzyme